ncbi:MAG: phage terminase small subunit [Burkholderiaceae bacterium]|nr:phage terminase small subunit [Burkholderiaceae bacterium]
MGHLADHFKRVQAARQAAASVNPEALAVEQEGRTQYEHMLLLLDTHQQQLRNLQSMKARAAHKATLLGEYAPYLAGLVEAGASQQDNVLVTLMLWHFDCALIGEALELADVALASKMAMPEQHRRNLATVVVEETADLLLAGKGADTTYEALGYINQAEHMTEGADMPDPVRAKLLKAKGRALRAVEFGEGDEAEAIARDEQALAVMKRALALDKNAGVKKDIEQLERQIKNAGKAAD